MEQTKLMRADEIANGFNSVAERQYWKASLAGTRLNPEVHFNSRASMVRVVFRISHDDFTVTFAKSVTTFGDFLASVFKSMQQVTTGLKAAGLPFTAVLGYEATLRIEYSPNSKDAVIHLARMGDDWPDAEPASFKVPERKIDPEAFSGLDEL